MTDLTAACDVLAQGAEGFHVASEYLGRAAVTVERMPATVVEFGFLSADRGLLTAYQDVIERMHEALCDGDQVFVRVADLLRDTEIRYRRAEHENAVGITKAGER